MIGSAAVQTTALFDVVSYMDRRKTHISKYIPSNYQTYSKIAPIDVGGNATVNAYMRSLLSDSCADITFTLVDFSAHAHCEYSTQESCQVQMQDRFPKKVK